MLTPTYFGETADGPRRTVFRAAETGQQLDGFDGLWQIVSGPPLTAYTSAHDHAWFDAQYQRARIRPQLDNIDPPQAAVPDGPRTGHGVSQSRVEALIVKLAKNADLTERQTEDLTEILGAI